MHSFHVSPDEETKTKTAWHNNKIAWHSTAHHHQHTANLASSRDEPIGYSQPEESSYCFGGCVTQGVDSIGWDGDLPSWPCGRRAEKRRKEEKKEEEEEEKREERQEEERDSPPPSPPLHPHALTQRGHDMWESSGRAYMYSVDGEALTEERKRERRKKKGERERGIYSMGW